MEESSVWGFYGLLRAVSYDDAGSFADRLLAEWLLWRHYYSGGGVCRHGRPGADYGMHRGFGDFGRVAFGGVALQRKGYALSVYFISIWRPAVCAGVFQGHAEGLAVSVAWTMVFYCVCHCRSLFPAQDYEKYSGRRFKEKGK